MKKSFYITTTLPYVNARPHIGMALEVVQADALARYRRLQGDEVLFNFGTDEHGQKILDAAKKEGKDPQKYTDEYSATFQKLKEVLDLSYDLFVRTTDPHHKLAAQEFWRRCVKAGDIYKKNYKIKYCVGCELEKTDSELVEGKCALHPKLEIEFIDEENYFFRLSKYQGALLELYKKEDFLIPRFRLNEMIAFIEREGLEDFSISRLKSKMSWGVDVPDEEAGLPAGRQVMYVWFDALVNYISAIGWPEKMEKFKQWWPVIQFAGKDNTRQQAAMWQAMLLSAGLSPSRQIVIHGFITSGGAKTSKSAGNVIDPIAIVDEYGTDALRYYLLSAVSPFEDSDFTMEKFKESYNGNLANGLGNLVSRIMKMSEVYQVSSQLTEVRLQSIPPEYQCAMESYRYNDAMDVIWENIRDADLRITETEPFKLVKTDAEAGKKIITELMRSLAEIAQLLTPLMPATSEAIQTAIRSNRPPAPLFMRK